MSYHENLTTSSFCFSGICFSRSKKLGVRVMGKRVGHTTTGEDVKHKKTRTTSDDPGGKSVGEKSKSTGGKCVCEKELHSKSCYRSMDTTGA